MSCVGTKSSRRSMNSSTAILPMRALLLLVRTVHYFASQPKRAQEVRERIYKTTEAKGSVRQPDGWFEQLDRKWPRDLSGRWHSILLDEAHHVNSDSLAQIAIKFMDCPFTVLCNVASLFTGIRDSSTRNLKLQLQNAHSIHALRTFQKFMLTRIDFRTSL